MRGSGFPGTFRTESGKKHEAFPGSCKRIRYRKKLRRRYKKLGIELKYIKRTERGKESGRVHHHLFLTGEQPGVWYGEALVGQQARGMTRKWITIVVYDDSEYTTMTLPAALNVIDEEAFEGIAANKVIVPDGCERIEARAFMNCPNLREIHIPNSVYSIGDDVFSGCDDVVIITDNGVIQEWADNHDILWFNE